MLILNLKNMNNEEQIKENHRKLLMINHPDKGGSTYIANKINKAKETIQHFLGHRAG